MDTGSCFSRPVFFSVSMYLHFRGMVRTGTWQSSSRALMGIYENCIEINKILFKSVGRGGKTETMLAGKCEKVFQKHQETLYTSWKYENVQNAIFSKLSMALVIHYYLLYWFRIIAKFSENQLQWSGGVGPKHRFYSLIIKHPYFWVWGMRLALLAEFLPSARADLLCVQIFMFRWQLFDLRHALAFLVSKKI